MSRQHDGACANEPDVDLSQRSMGSDMMTYGDGDGCDVDVSLCDDYSLPVDFVNKRRPASVPTPVPTTTVQWTLPSPTIETAEIEVVEQYSDPKDSKNRAYVEPGVDSPQPAVHAKPNRNYCRPYTEPSEGFKVPLIKSFKRAGG
ncbi:hypothetical protein TSAR_005280 [Trichomalopsis sarcophagae]|uniref:Uncharacterized protein n=1 Tax=Trichomalopsis sarcophagae TaxID=543379 RepID=A0A232EZI0_9HYME|nr:hypothetical protein TSAR_005280 [Trichomalopsis sarcophagae]